MTMKRMMVLASFLSVGIGMARAAECVWIGGDGDSWAVNENWLGGVKPGSGDVAVFTSDALVSVLSENTVGGLEVRAGRVRLRCETTVKSVKIPNGTSAAVNDAVCLAPGASLVLDGPDLLLGNYRNLRLGAGARLEVPSSSLALAYGNLIVEEDARVVVSGGTLTFGNNGFYIVLGRNAELRVTGGVCDLPRVSNFVNPSCVDSLDGPGSKIIIDGGHLKCITQYSFAGSFYNGVNTSVGLRAGRFDANTRLSADLPGSCSFLPPKNGVLNVTCKGLGFQTDELVDGIYWLGGDMYQTNYPSGTDMSYANLARASANDLLGGGSLYLPRIVVNGATMNADLSKVCLADGFSSNARTGGQMYFRDGVVFGAFGDVGVDEDTSRIGVVSPEGRVVFDTLDCFDRTTTHTFTLNRRFDFAGTTALAARGGGTVDLTTRTTFGSCLDDLSVEAGTTLTLAAVTGGVVANRLTLGDNATLDLGGNVLDVALAADIGPGARIRFAVSDLTAGTMRPVWFGPHGSTPPVEKFDFDPAIPEGWSLVTQGSTAYLSDGTIVDVTTTDRCYWKGTAGGLWNNTDNWTPHDGTPLVPGGSISYYAYFTGNRQLCVTNDWAGKTEAWLRNLIAQAGAGPYTISGNPIKPVYPSNWSDSSASVGNNSAFPFTVETLLGKYPHNNTKESFFYAQANSAAPVVMTGGGNLTNAVVMFRGDVRVGGEWKAIGLRPATSTVASRPSRFTVLPGATFAVADQGSNQTVVASYAVAAGATLDVAGQVWRWTRTENGHRIDGLVEARCPMQATARQTFRGAGRLNIASARADAEGASSFKFAESLTVRPAAWLTVRETADNPLQMVLRDEVTLGAPADWTYGPAAGFASATDARDRALLVQGGSKTRVSVDTEGHEITLADPLVMERWSTLVKKGAGTLALASRANELADLELVAGSLKISSPATVDVLTVTGGEIVLDGELRAAVQTGAWTPILTARRIVGSVGLGDRYKVLCETMEDGVRVSVREKKGLVVLFR